MSEKTKVLLKSHAMRLAEVSPYYSKRLVCDYDVRGVEEFVENGRLMKRSCVSSVHPQDKFSGFKADDFALENIIAVGAIGDLKECKLSVNTIGELSDVMDSSIDNAIAAVDAAEAAAVQTEQTNQIGEE